MHAQIIDAEVREVPSNGEQRREPITLTGRSMSRWLTATRAALDVVEREEAAATAEYDRIRRRAEGELEAARAKVREKRQAAALLRQVLSAVKADASVKALAAPSQPALAEGQWHRRYKQCGGCGSTDHETRPHFAFGHCRPCAVEKWPGRFKADRGGV